MASPESIPEPREPAESSEATDPDEADGADGSRPRRGRPPAREGAPRGEHEVRASLIAAASELFAARGPGAVSVRVVAETAGVNHGLVHHYFGSKEGLITAVLDHLSQQAAHELDEQLPSTVMYARGGPTERHGRIMAYLLLDDGDPIAHKRDFPAVKALIKGYRENGLTLREARERAAQVTALVIGWQLFEPFLTAAADLDVSDKTRARLLDDAIGRLSRPSPATPDRSGTRTSTPRGPRPRTTEPGAHRP